MKFKKFVTLVLMSIMVFLLVAPNITFGGGPVIYCPRCKGGSQVIMYASGEFCEGHEGTYTPATCEKPGTLTCTKCPGKGVSSADHNFDVEISWEPALGHDWGEPVRENYIEPTCVAAGEYDEVYYCQRQGCTAEIRNHITLDLDPDNHVGFEIAEGWNATCVEPGLTPTTYCEGCQYILIPGDIIPRLEPVWGEPQVKKEPTCTTKGLQYVYCVNCEGKAEGHSKSEFIDPLGHDIQHTQEYCIAKIEPTCSSKGQAVYKCSRCDYKETDYFDVLEPDWSTWKTFKYPSCVEDGVECRECQLCNGSAAGHSETRAIPKLDIEWGEWTTIRKPTCLKAGVERRKCVNCLGEAPNHLETRTIPALGHIWGEPEDDGWDKRPTCTEDGRMSQKHICEVCDAEETIEPRVIPAYGHDIEHTDEYLVEHTDATCLEDGKLVWKCGNCDYTEEEIIQAIGHDWGEWGFNWISDDEVYIFRNCNNNKEHAESHKLHTLFLRYYPPTCTESGRWETMVYTDYDNILSDEPCIDWYFIHKDKSSILTTDESQMYIDPLEHVPVNMEHVDPWCEDKGYDGGVICDRCHTILEKPEESDELGHIWGEPLLHYVNQHSLSFEIPCERDSDHNIGFYASDVVYVPYTPETCHIDGMVAHYKFYDESGVFGTDQYVYIYNVHKCGDYYLYTATTNIHDILIEPYGPQWGEWEVVTEPTCTTDGVEVRVCEECDGAILSHKDTRVVAKLGHDIEHTQDYLIMHEDPTCTSYGCDLYACARCGRDYTETDYIYPLGHIKGDPVIENEIKPTCLDSGQYDSVVYCTREGCGVEVTRETIYTSPTGHNLEEYLHDSYPETCTQIGVYVYYKHCVNSGCEHDEYSRFVITDPMGHDIEHTDKYLVDHKDPTCTEEGYDIWQCSRCEYTETEPISALGHNWEEYVKEHKDPTCEDDGYDITNKKCECGEDEFVKKEIIPATGHTWGEEYEVVVKEPTEDEEGLIEIRHKCEVCETEKVIGTKVIPVLEPETETETETETEEPTEPETQTETETETETETQTETETVTEPETETETETYEPWTEPETTTTDPTGVPKMGDESNVTLWITLMAVAMAICGTSIVILGKKRKN